MYFLGMYRRQRVEHRDCGLYSQHVRQYRYLLGISDVVSGGQCHYSAQGFDCESTPEPCLFTQAQVPLGAQHVHSNSQGTAALSLSAMAGNSSIRRSALQTHAITTIYNSLHPQRVSRLCLCSSSAPPLLRQIRPALQQTRQAVGLCYLQVRCAASPKLLHRRFQHQRHARPLHVSMGPGQCYNPSVPIKHVTLQTLCCCSTLLQL